MSKQYILNFLRENYNITGTEAESVISQLPENWEILDELSTRALISVITSNRKRIVGNNTNRVTKLLDTLAIEIVRNFNGVFAFKGGYVLGNILEEARSTTDVDLSIENINDYNKIKRILIEIGDRCVKEKLIASYKVKEDISDVRSGGATYYDEKGKVIFGVDISIHELFMGISSMKFRIGNNIPTFSIERMLADKISAILSEKRFRRPKDLYDLYCLIQAFSIEYKALKDNLDYRMQNCMSNWDNIPFDDTIMEKYSHAWNKLILTKYCTNESIEKEDLSRVITLFYRFIEPFKNKETKTMWDNNYKKWR